MGVLHHSHTAKKNGQITSGRLMLLNEKALNGRK
jgi:hypothetical protein